MPSNVFDELIDEIRSFAQNVIENNNNLTHWDSSKEEVTMVDVSSKKATLRNAVAQSIVTLPIEVLKALVPLENRTDLKEIQGPKGPIFATARIAGTSMIRQSTFDFPLRHSDMIFLTHIYYPCVGIMAAK